MANYASQLIKVAEAEVGYLEKKSNSNLDSKTANAGYNNYNKYARDFDKTYTTFYNGKKQAAHWCDIFVDWCFVKAFGEKEALKLLGQPKKSCGAGCSFSANYYKQIGCFSTTPTIGAQIFFTNSQGSVSHTGIVYKVDSNYVYTIEGNTSSASGVVANGGAVAKKKYTLKYSRIYGYGVPKYDKEKVTKYKPTVKEWQLAAIADGFKFPKYGADGNWGAECESVANKAVVKKRLVYKYKNLTKLVQKALGIEVDGYCGKDTDKAIRAFQKANGLTVDGSVGAITLKKLLNIK